MTVSSEVMGTLMPALVTPFRADGGLDVDGLERLVDRARRHGADGVSPLGSTGEGALLETAEKVEVVRALRTIVGPGWPVVAGVLQAAPASARAELLALAEAGATAALVPPPFYYPLRPAEVEAYFAWLAEESPIPLVLYQIPQMTKISIAPAVVAKLARLEWVVGMKDSSRDLEYFEAVVAEVAGADFRLVTGSDTMLSASMVAGGGGMIGASANVAADLSRAIIDEVASGQLDAARLSQERLRQVVLRCRTLGTPTGWKAAAAALGLCEATMHRPLEAASEQAVAELSGDLAALGVS